MHPGASRAIAALNENIKAEQKLKSKIKKADKQEDRNIRDAAFGRAQAALYAQAAIQIRTSLAESTAVHDYTENYGQ